jgi:putative ABC transport system permease protein
MRRVTLRSLWAHKRRLVSTILAVLLGVAFMAGTFVLSDTIQTSFDDIFADLNAELDAQVQGEVLFSSDFGDQRAPIDESVLDAVAEVDGVADAAPYAFTQGGGSTNRVLGADGEPIGAFGPPTLFESWIDADALNPYDVVDGRPPEVDGEITLNVAAAEDGELALGDDVTLVTQHGQVPYELVGITQVRGEDSLAGSVSVGLTLAEAQRLAGLEGQVNQVLVDAEDGVSQEEVTARVADVLPDGVEVITGEQATEELSSDVSSGFSFVTTILSVFGGLALLVGIFVISNTFSILVAQRTRELALLRAVGASRRQVLGSVLLEAVVIGLVAAALGLAAGVGLAALAFGAFDLPGSLVLEPDTVVTAVLIGLVITVLAAVVPAVRATRVPPLAALRDVAIERTDHSKLRLALGAVATVAGLVAVSQAWLGPDDENVLPTVGIGAVLLVAAAITLGPVMAGRTVRIIGAWAPKVKGLTGRLAVENAARSPKRTAATASSLIIGVALVAFITVFTASARATTDAALDRGFLGDFVVQNEGGFTGFFGFPPTVTDAVADVDGVDLVSPFSLVPGQITYPDGDVSDVLAFGAVPETLEAVLDVEMAEGSVADLTDDGIVLDEQVVDDHGLAIGDTVTMRVPGGAEVALEVQAVSDDELALGSYTVSRDAFQALMPEPVDVQVFGTVDDGADLDEVLAAVEDAIAEVPSVTVLDKEGFQGAIAESINQVLTMVLVLLLLSIVIAAIGIANTLSLSVHERVRELGLLRAVGMDRRQLRGMVRWEAVMISVLGAVVGLVLGTGLSWAVVTALGREGLDRFAVPPAPLVVIVLAAALLGVLASILPARRAARLPVLEAIANE